MINASHTMLAQFNAVPADFLRDFIIVVVAIAAIVVPIWLGTRRKPVTIDPQPLEVRKSAKRYNHDLAENRHTEHTRRLDAHEAEIEQIWNTFREEDKAIRKETQDKYDFIARSLHRIEGHLNKKLGEES